MAEVLASSAMTDLALAETKKHGASYKDLHIGAGIKLTHHQNLKMIAAGGGEEVGAIELEQEDPKRTAFIERLKAMAEVSRALPSAATEETK